MAHLQESEKSYYNPKGFCNAFKDWDNQPMDIKEQKDTTEFLSMLFMKIEGLTQGQKKESLLKDCFGGILSSELLAEEDRYKEREETYNYLNIQIQNNKDLAEGLRQYTSEETVDYRWDKEPNSD